MTHSSCSASLKEEIPSPAYSTQSIETWQGRQHAGKRRQQFRAQKWWRDFLFQSCNQVSPSNDLSGGRRTENEAEGAALGVKTKIRTGRPEAASCGQVGPSLPEAGPSGPKAVVQSATHQLRSLSVKL